MGAGAGAVSATGSNREFTSYLYYGYIKNVNDVIRLIDIDDLNDTKKGSLVFVTLICLYYMDLVQIMEYKNH